MEIKGLYNVNFNLFQGNKFNNIYSAKLSFFKS